MWRELEVKLSHEARAQHNGRAWLRVLSWLVINRAFNCRTIHQIQASSLLTARLYEPKSVQARVVWCRARRVGFCRINLSTRVLRLIYSYFARRTGKLDNWYGSVKSRRLHKSAKSRLAFPLTLLDALYPRRAFPGLHTGSFMELWDD